MNKTWKLLLSAGTVVWLACATTWAAAPTRPVIHRAAAQGDPTWVRLLLDQTPQLLDLRDSSGWTPLHEAAYAGHVDIVRLLLKYGAQANARGLGRATPLHQAATAGRAEVIDVLAEQYIKIDARDANGMTPLHKAAMMGHTGAARALLLHGADADFKDHRGLTAADWAEQKKHSALAQLLTKPSKPEALEVVAMEELIPEAESEEFVEEEVLFETAPLAEFDLEEVFVETEEDFTAETPEPTGFMPEPERTPEPTPQPAPEALDVFAGEVVEPPDAAVEPPKPAEISGESESHPMETSTATTAAATTPSHALTPVLTPEGDTTPTMQVILKPDDAQ